MQENEPSIVEIATTPEFVVLSAKTRYGWSLPVGVGMLGLDVEVDPFPTADGIHFNQIVQINSPFKLEERVRSVINEPDPTHVVFFDCASESLCVQVVEAMRPCDSAPSAPCALGIRGKTDYEKLTGA